MADTVSDKIEVSKKDMNLMGVAISQWVDSEKEMKKTYLSAQAKIRLLYAIFSVLRDKRRNEITRIYL